MERCVQDARSVLATREALARSRRDRVPPAVSQSAPLLLPAEGYREWRYEYRMAWESFCTRDIPSASSSEDILPLPFNVTPINGGTQGRDRSWRRGLHGVDRMLRHNQFRRVLPQQFLALCLMR